MRRRRRRRRRRSMRQLLPKTPVPKNLSTRSRSRHSLSLFRSGGSLAPTRQLLLARTHVSCGLGHFCDLHRRLVIQPLLFESFHDSRSTQRVLSTVFLLDLCKSQPLITSGRKSLVDCPCEVMLALASLAFSLRTDHALHDLTTSMIPEQRHNHRQHSRTSLVPDTLATNQTSHSICSSSVDVHTAAST